MVHQLTRNNHYVPVWYQKRFLAPGASQLYYLDTNPDKRDLPEGRVLVSRPVPKAPKSCFCELDLYTTQFGDTLNDEIERYLFGAIDDEGAIAVRAFISGDHALIHKSFGTFFEYLDAQKLRTPKGLDWIKSRYPTLTQLELMREMQELRLMHCTMWAEGVREIVSAKQSDVKFIVTDHPVTVHNAAFPLESADCAYPADPSIELIGSQTVFVLDPDNCLILTHLEYAKHPDRATLTASRTNARYRGQGLARTDAFIRTRKLEREEVIGINYLLKSRARRYVAAADKEWLYPELSFTGGCTDIAKILLPRDDLWQFGGEIHVGYTDGSIHYQDAFGRTSGSHKYLQKKRRSTVTGPNDPCGCGSGHKFKQCCKTLPETERPSWDVYGIRERNLMFCRAVKEILGMQSGKTWDDVRRELSDEQVKRIHEAVSSLWPVDTDLVDLLPRPVKGKFRAVYLGAPDPRTVMGTITGWLAYFDQLIIPHPFLNPARIRPEYSPTEAPSQHKEQTLKNVLLLFALEPYIHIGHVHLVPDPSDFNNEFAMTVMQMTKERTAGWTSDEESKEQFRQLSRDDYTRFLRRLPEESLRQHVRDQCPEFSNEQIGVFVTRMKVELVADPYALLQPIEPGKAGVQTRIIKGYGLETAMYLAGLTGSVIYTDMKAQWQQLHEHASAMDLAQVDDTWGKVIDAARAIDFPIELEWKASFEARRAGKFGQMRLAISRIGEAIQDKAGAARATQLVSQLSCAAEGVRREWTKSSSTTRLNGRIDISIPQRGFERNGIRRLLLTFGRAKVVNSIPLALLIRT